MKISFLTRILAFLQGNMIVQIYSSKNNRSYATIAYKNRDNQWACTVPRYIKTWEYAEIILLENGQLLFLDAKLNDGSLDAWK